VHHVMETNCANKYRFNAFYVY